MAATKRRASSNAESDAKRQAQDQQMDVEAVISMLRLPDGVQVSSEYANHKSTQAQIQAYAKLSGPSWTFYVQRLEVVIGRRAVDCFDPVDIDLGPSKIVSRRHAVLKYNTDSRHWELEIIGRNGIRVDCTTHKQGKVVLESGNIVDIGGVQMMFVLPDVPPQVNKSLLSNLILRRNHSLNAPMSLSPQQSLSGGESSPGAIKQMVPHNPPQSQAPEAPKASYPNGIAIVTRPQVRELGNKLLDQDLSQDSCKDIKPPFSYATMISQAILSTADSSMSLADIYLWISSNYSFYRHSKPGWQNSIRHNLSLNKAFEKVPRKENEPGKGSKWQITAKYREEFIRKANAGKLIKGRSQLQFKPVPKKGDEFVKLEPKPELAAPAPPDVPRGPQWPRGQQEQQEQPGVTMAAPEHAADARPPHDATPVPPVSHLALEEEPLLPQPLNHSPTRTPWLSRFAGKLGEETDRPYLEFLDSECHANSPAQHHISQLEAYTPDRGSKMTPLKGGSPAFWKYMHLNDTPIKNSPIKKEG